MATAWFGPSPDWILKHRTEHPSAKTILLTGATGGIGLAVARRLLSSPDEHLLILTGRNAEVLRQFQREYPDRVRAVQCDMADLGQVAGLVRQCEVHGSLDALILNHGTLGKCLRLAQMEGDKGEEWERVFKVNVTSCVVMISEALPWLRQTKGRIIFTSSGAAQNAYPSWGAYGASKAAINHLTMTLKNEEPDVTTVAIRPGVVDTAMQKDIRESFLSNMDERDQQKFRSAKEEGKLLPPEKPGNVIAELAVSAERELSGLFIR
ncbi:hypothetical protein A1O7_05613 [Cladophialophora yegresii CBS 114405]|uniref:Ketoreductase domain-containing protein n=1 Tax=Cladophialophora yegresii CBS 114405 TaxID=1182544 RepID=W9VRJ9_9EURO|nr:uncharacterized protein A1O7_05613 [Cladophialophora yegresii CBS 114405]EXJ58188.1 hypothetical protein A1O7_05613 [Cladophialophora yegresii CBS 114405]